ncbi:CshA/CshB family fibrillar adhesin-related protein [Porphyrobacter sp. CACIAM 03H1]|uniref:CshA/CshB family fibrillar adhesin-related protein n=1 Tax=Porphyrobacter sp. CACIAM 03H1 TaxID=2003315 RepID=UPI0012FE70E2|nr:CshA/CshB family fibrillar adhesin-related protein [Porphyrobacter sp. CACIAM 03H1]
MNRTARPRERFANRLFTMLSYAEGMNRLPPLLRKLMALCLLVVGLMWSPAAHAQSCGTAASQGTAPSSWQTYCWLDLAQYNDSTARSASGQNMTFTLTDGSVLRFNLRVTGGSGTAYNTVAAPSWSGSSVGNTSFIGIPGRPVLYTASAGTRLVTISGISITPPTGAAASVFAFVVADGESSNDGEALRLGTNGGAWQVLDIAPPISGSTIPLISGVGTSNVTITGAPGTVGAHILSSNSPSTVTVETQAGGLQGVMFAVRFASIRLEKRITGPRANAADQFRFEIVSTANNAVLSSGVTTSTGSGPFLAPTVTMAAGVPITVRESMASGSVSSLAQYSASLTCSNIAGPTRAGLPNNLAATSASLGQLQFGEALVCTFTNGAHPRVQLRKQMGIDGRRFTGDQFTVRVREGETIVAQTTTTGSNTTVNNGDTDLVQLVSGTAYTLDEIAAGTANLGNYTATMACTNSFTGSATALPTAVGGTIIPQLGDTITCTITNTRRAVAVLVIEKTSTVISDPVNGNSNPKLIPGAIVEYAITVRNVGSGRPDNASIVLLDIMPPQMAFATGTPVTFANGPTASGLSTFNAGSMVRFSSAQGGAAPYTYNPVGTFDTNVRGIRIIPGGRMAAATSGTVQPSFTIRFRAQLQ